MMILWDLFLLPSITVAAIATIISMILLRIRNKILRVIIPPIIIILLVDFQVLPLVRNILFRPDISLIEIYLYMALGILTPFLFLSDYYYIRRKEIIVCICALTLTPFAIFPALYLNYTHQIFVYIAGVIISVPGYLILLILDKKTEIFRNF